MLDCTKVPIFNGHDLIWSNPDERDVTMAAGPLSGEFYFVQNDGDSVWAGIILGNRAWSRIVDNVEAGKTACEADMKWRIHLTVGVSRFMD